MLRAAPDPEISRQDWRQGVGSDFTEQSSGMRLQTGCDWLQWCYEKGKSLPEGEVRAMRGGIHKEASVEEVLQCGLPVDGVGCGAPEGRKSDEGNE